MENTRAHFARVVAYVFMAVCSLHHAIAIEVSTSTVASLPRPVYDMLWLDRTSTALCLASTGEGAKLDFTAPVPPPAVYSVNLVDNTVKKLLTFSAGLFQYRLERIDRGEELFLLYDTDTRLGVFQVLPTKESAKQLPILREQEFNAFATSKLQQYLLGGTSSGTLLLYSISQTPNHGTPVTLAEVTSTSVGAKAIDSITPADATTFLVTTEDRIITLKAEHDKLLKISERTIKKIPEVGGFLGPIFLVSKDGNGLISYVNGRNTIESYSPETGSGTALKLDELGMIETWCTSGPWTVVGDLDGNVAIVDLDQQSVLWQDTVCSSQVKAIISLRPDSYLIADWEGNLTKLNVKHDSQSLNQ